MIRKDPPNLSLAIAVVLAFAEVGCGGSSDTAVTDTSSQPSDATVLSLSDELTAVYKARDWTRLKALVAPDYVGTVQDARWDIAGLEKEIPENYFARYTPQLILCASA